MQHPRLATIAIALALSLAAAACGSDTGSTTAAQAPDTTVAPATDEAVADEEMAEDEEAMAEDEMAEDEMAEEEMAEDEEAMTDEEMAEDEEAMAEDEMAEDEMAEDEEAMADLPAWLSTTITDVDGVAFTLDDFHGSKVLVETFATWCPNCREQLKATNEFAASAGDAVTVIALSVETDLSPDDVRAYADENGFDSVRFAVVSPEMLAALVDGFGQTIANPPSTPKFVIDEMGAAGELTTGAESAEDLAGKLGVGA